MREIAEKIRQSAAEIEAGGDGLTPDQLRKIASLIEKLNSSLDARRERHEYIRLMLASGQKLPVN